MEFNEVLKKRRCIRSYTGELVSEEEEKKILAAAESSPASMGEYDAVHITVIKNKDMLEKIEKFSQELFHTDRSLLYNAPELIIVSVKADDNPNHSNAAIVAHNMLLEAVNMGVGACYIWGCTIAVSHNLELIKALNIPDGFIPAAGISLGISNEIYEDREIPEGRIAVNYI